MKIVLIATIGPMCYCPRALHITLSILHFLDCFTSRAFECLLNFVIHVNMRAIWPILCTYYISIREFQNNHCNATYTNRQAKNNLQRISSHQNDVEYVYRKVVCLPFPGHAALVFSFSHFILFNFMSTVHRLVSIHVSLPWHKLTAQDYQELFL